MPASARRVITNLSAIFALLLVNPGLAQLEYPGEIEFTGSEEIIFDWSADSCEQIDIPDAPVRAFRDAVGKINLLSTHYTNYRMVGNDFNSLVRDCSAPVLDSHFDSDPAQFNDFEWLVSTYTHDGKTIYAIVHNEYHGADHTDVVDCPSGDAARCWYNALTFATSTDSGHTFTHASAPNHLLAAAPYQYSADNGPFGFFGGTNIVYDRRDSYYYAIIQVEAFGLQQVGVTTMRTQTIADPSSWRGWDGSGYNVSFVNPYTDTFDPADHIVQPIGAGNIEKMQGNLTWSTYFDKWLLVGAAQKSGVWGFYYSISDDLIHWVTRKSIMTANVNINPNRTAGVDVLAYPTIIDHADTTRNFEQTGQDVYLYYVRQHPTSLYDRDLVRIPMRFSKLLVSGYEVTGKGDLEDKNVGDGICKTSAGLCSFRAALQEANARIPSWADSVLNITFNLSGTGTQTLTVGGVQNIWYPLNIDGFTQPGASANTNNFSNGQNTVPGVELNFDGNPGLSFENGHNTVKGLVINTTQGPALTFMYEDSNVVQGCFLNIDKTGTSVPSSHNDGIKLWKSNYNHIGGTAPGDRNLIIGGVRIQGPDSRYNLVQGNYIGTDITGTIRLDYWAAGVQLQDDAQHNTIGGMSVSARNLLSGNNSHGVAIEGSGTSDNLVLNNFIGLNAAGTGVIGNGLSGVIIQNGAEGNFIGKPGAGNIIAGGNDSGISLNSPRNFIQGNFIGTDSTGTTDVGNLGAGILIFSDGDELHIGGANAGEANTIAFNNNGGLAVLGGPVGIKIWNNAFYRNDSRSGIDLGFDGWTQNDDGDGDSGANGFQNYPVLTDAISGNLFVSGTLNSTASTTFRIEFFVNDSCDPSGYGEGQQYLDAIAVDTDANGDASFSVQLSQQVPEGKYITATASAPDNSTSEFSQCLLAQPAAGNLVASPTEISVTLEPDASTSELLLISNTGNLSVDWTVTWGQSWLNATPVTRNIDPGATDTVMVTLDATGLSENTYIDTIWVTPSDGDNAGVVTVTLTVDAVPNAVITPDSLVMSAAIGGQATQSVQIKNTGSAALNWNAATNFQDTWLAADPRSGSLPPGDSTVFHVTARSDNLAAGVHSGDAFVTSNDPDDPNIIIPVTFTVVGDGPQISVTPMTIATTLATDSSITKQLVINNFGNEDLDWAAANTQNWVSVSPDSGLTGAGGADTLQVTISSAGLNNNSYGETIVISSNDADDPTVDVSVLLTVADLNPKISVSQNNLVSTLQEGQTASHAFDIGNIGDAEMQWSMTWQTAWLSVEPISGSTSPGNSQNVSVVLDATSLASGEYADTLEISSTDPETPVSNISVHLTVSQQIPEISVSQDNLVSTLADGDSTKHPLSIANYGTGPLSWSLQWQASWATFEPQQGNTAAGQTQELEAWFRSVGLAPGAYRDTLLVNSNDPQKPISRVALSLDVPAPRPMPHVWVEPDSFHLTLFANQDASEMLVIHNDGQGSANWQLSTEAAAPWVKTTQTSGTIGSNKTREVRMDFSSHGMSQGTYRSKILLKSNDPDHPEIEIPAALTVGTTTAVGDANSVPERFTLSQNYPNPFNPTTTIHFGLPKDARVILVVYDITGRVVRTLASGQHTAGNHQVAWDATDSSGHKVGSGMYFFSVRFRTADGGRFLMSRKMLLLK